MKQTITALFVGLAALIIFHPSPARAADFNMNYIVSDDEFTDNTSMSAAKIQEFLNNQTGILDTYKTTIDGVEKTAAQIIADAANTYHISPRVILTNIQKESSMLSRTNFGSNGQDYYLDWIMFYGWCDSCSTGTKKGFYNQINAATAAFRRYLDAISLQGFTISYWGPNITKSLTCIGSDASRGLCVNGSTISITPVNAATSALYTYTPHPGGNFSFWSIWNTYGFGSRRTYPDGSILRASGSGTIYVIQNGLKRPFMSTAAFLSRYSYSNVITVSADVLFFYDEGKPIKFANYSLLQPPKRGVFLLVDDTLRPITNPGFKAAGFQRSEVIKVSAADIADYQIGVKITSLNAYPSGQILRDKTTKRHYFVKDGVKQLILSGQIYTSQFGKRHSIWVKSSVLESYIEGAPVGFKDGELVALKGADGKATGSVYFISNGQRLPIKDWAAVKAYKFDLIWKNLILTNQKSLDVHPIGEMLTADLTPVVAN